MTSPLFAIIAFDAPEMQGARIEHREGHLAHFKAHKKHIAVSGPLSGSLDGSLIIYQANTIEEARDFVERDPFSAAGVWERVEVTNFKAAMGIWIE